MILRETGYDSDVKYLRIVPNGGFWY